VTTPTFRKMAAMAQEDLLVKPLLFRYFFEAQFPKEWTVTFRQEQIERGPDGWFHPSSHPLMTARQLYYYLTEPEKWQGWTPDYVLRMSTLMGSALHDFIEMALKHLGLLIEPSGACQACGRPQPTQCSEHGAKDAETGSRGHMDGVLKLDRLGLVGFEFKTAIPAGISQIADGDVAAFRKKWPYYFAQINEYMRMTGMRTYIVLFMGLGNPWEMREFKIDYDFELGLKTERKYLEVRRAVELGVPPQLCCAPRSKQARECPAAGCAVKQA
jgi:hypothetical protein